MRADPAQLPPRRREGPSSDPTAGPHRAGRFSPHISQSRRSRHDRAEGRGPPARRIPTERPRSAGSRRSALPLRRRRAGLPRTRRDRTPSAGRPGGSGPVADGRVVLGRAPRRRASPRPTLRSCIRRRARGSSRRSSSGTAFRMCLCDHPVEGAQGQKILEEGRIRDAERPRI